MQRLLVVVITGRMFHNLLVYVVIMNFYEVKITVLQRKSVSFLSLSFIPENASADVLPLVIRYHIESGYHILMEVVGQSISVGERSGDGETERLEVHQTDGPVAFYGNQCHHRDERTQNLSYCHL